MLSKLLQPLNSAIWSHHGAQVLCWRSAMKPHRSVHTVANTFYSLQYLPWSEVIKIIFVCRSNASESQTNCWWVSFHYSAETEIMHIICILSTYITFNSFVTFLLNLFQRNTKDSNILHFLRDGEFKRFLQLEGTLEQVHGLTFHTDLQGKQSLWATDVGNGGSSNLNLL